MPHVPLLVVEDVEKYVLELKQLPTHLKYAFLGKFFFLPLLLSLLI